MEWPAIWFGIIFWKDLEEKSYWVNPMEKLINNRIQLSNYGQGLKHIRFVLIAVPPDNKMHEEGIRYSARKKQLLLYKKLDYQAVLEADQPAFQRLVAQLFLKSIDDYAKRRIQDFDRQRFREDMTALFIEQGWIQPENQQENGV
jgi:hypothetical protein